MVAPSRTTEDIIGCLDEAAQRLERALEIAKSCGASYPKHISRMAELYNGLNSLYQAWTDEIGRKLGPGDELPDPRQSRPAISSSKPRN